MSNDNKEVMDLLKKVLVTLDKSNTKTKTVTKDVKPKRIKKHWTDEETNILFEMKGALYTNKEIGKVINKTSQQVSSRITLLRSKFNKNIKPHFGDSQ